MKHYNSCLKECSRRLKWQEKYFKKKKKQIIENSLPVQKLGHHAFSVEAPGSIPGLGSEIPPAVHHDQKQVNKKSSHGEYTVYTTIYKHKHDAYSIDAIKYFIFWFLAAECGMQDLSSPIRDQIHAPCIGSMES